MLCGKATGQKETLALVANPIEMDHWLGFTNMALSGANNTSGVPKEAIEEPIFSSSRNRILNSKTSRERIVSEGEGTTWPNGKNFAPRQEAKVLT